MSTLKRIALAFADWERFTKRCFSLSLFWCFFGPPYFSLHISLFFHWKIKKSDEIIFYFRWKPFCLSKAVFLNIFCYTEAFWKIKTFAKPLYYLEVHRGRFQIAWDISTLMINLAIRNVLKFLTTKLRNGIHSVSLMYIFFKSGRTPNARNWAKVF